MICKNCGSTSFIRKGWDKQVFPYRQRFKCRSCGTRRFSDGGVKILLFDIETAMVQGYTWGIWQQDVLEVINDWFILSWSCKWLYDSETFSNALTPREALVRDDKRIVRNLWRFLNEADIVIAHNGDKFDVKKSNTRFLVHDIDPPLPYMTIDTLKVLKKKFAFTSNRLDFVNKALGLDIKMETDKKLWLGCLNGDVESLKKMEEYNRRDVGILEELYVKLRPWIPSHPNMGLFFDDIESVCPNCGSNILTWGGSYHTSVARYSTFRCECGAIGRSRHRMDKRDHLVTSIAR